MRAHLCPAYKTPRVSAPDDGGRYVPRPRKQHGNGYRAARDAVASTSVPHLTSTQAVDGGIVPPTMMIVGCAQALLEYYQRHNRYTPS